MDGGGAKVHSPPKFENPDTAFDNPDQMNEQEELEKEQDVRTRLLHGAHHPAIVNMWSIGMYSYVLAKMYTNNPISQRTLPAKHLGFQRQFVSLSFPMHTY